MKAFLSHSSADKEFVRAVSQDLGRQFCVFDEASFNNGAELREAITQGLGSAELFVLFLSREALESRWVQFEVEEAWYRRTHGDLKEVLVYLLDAGIQISELPEWVGRAKVGIALAPAPTAREIRDHLNRLLQRRQRPLFVGRARDVVRIEETLTPIEGPPPRAFVVAGLPGVGRRALLRKAIPQVLGLQRILEVSIGEGDSIQDISLAIAAKIEPVSTASGLARLAEEILAMEPAAAAARAIENVRRLTGVGDLVTLVDAGGVVREEGTLSDTVKKLLGGIAEGDSAYLAIVSRRRPQDAHEYSLPVVTLRPLGEAETGRLVKLLTEAREVRLSGAEVRTLAEHVAGYPPAAYYATEQCAVYGVHATLADASALTRFRSTTFVRHFAAVRLTDLQQNILKLLAIFSPLPFRSLVDATGAPAVSVANSLIYLVDLCFVGTTENPEYAIATPIADAALKVFGYPTPELSRTVARSLADFSASPPSATSLLQVARTMFRAATLGGDEVLAEQTLHLANDLVQVAEVLYHARRYSDAVRIARLALTKRPDATSTRSFLIRALAHEERWSEADEELAAYAGYGLERERTFLQGFIERKRGRFREAAAAYERSLALGRSGAAVRRELAQCYLMMGALDEAARHIEQGLRHDSGNKFFLDLAIQIATLRGDEATARRRLRELEVVEEDSWYQHRLSRLELSLGNPTEALVAAERACAFADPHFEVLAQLVHCQLLAGHTEQAAVSLDRLEARFGSIRVDIRLGLRARLAIKRRRYREALHLTEQFDAKGKAVHLATRLLAIRALLANVALQDAERASLRAEAEDLELTLRDKNLDLILF